MAGKKGFSLIEIVVVLVIVAVIAAIAIPSYNSYVQKAAYTSAQNTLVSIYNVEHAYYFNNGNWYFIPGGMAGACVGAYTCTALLNTNLSLNINDNNFDYMCFNSGQCLANSRVSGLSYLLRLTKPLVLSGGTGCATSTAASCNPQCLGSGTDCP